MKKWFAAAAAATVCLGCAWHFLYDWCPHFLVGLFAPVNGERLGTFEAAVLAGHPGGAGAGPPLGRAAGLERLPSCPAGNAGGAVRGLLSCCGRLWAARTGLGHRALRRDGLRRVLGGLPLEQCPAAGTAAGGAADACRAVWLCVGSFHAGGAAAADFYAACMKKTGNTC